MSVTSDILRSAALAERQTGQRPNVIYVGADVIDALLEEARQHGIEIKQGDRPLPITVGGIEVREFEMVRGG